MKEIVYIDQNLSEFIPAFIKDRKKDMVDLQGLYEKKSFNEMLDILTIIRENANIFGFKALSSMASHALTQAKKDNNEEEIGKLLGNMERHIKNVKIAYVEFDEDAEMGFPYGWEDKI